MSKTEWCVEVVAVTKETVVHLIDCGSSRARAEKVEAGVNINLNHGEYFTRVTNSEGTVI